MADIYRRAQRVLVWLGTVEGPEPPKAKPLPKRSSFRISRRDERKTETKSQEEKLREAEEQEVAEYHNLCQKPYWTRVWIVQEVGAAVDLDIHWDVRPKTTKKLISKSASWKDFFDTVQRLKADGASNRANELAQQRKDRHGDAFLLSNLIEASADAVCELPQDKIYGFVGIAHDCEDGSFPVDYSKSLWNMYEDVIGFQKKQTTTVGAANAAKSLVHLSQTVLDVLKKVNAPDNLVGCMQSARCELCRGHYEDGNSLFKITSAYGGVISILGPSYDVLTGNPSVRRDWNLALEECVTEDHAKLREANEIFITRILALDDSEIHKSVSSIPSYGWRYSPANRTHISRICYPKSSPSTFPDNGTSKWQLFATAEGTIGLVPSCVRTGDMICHFWKSGIVAVIRAEDEWTWRIVGKALLADQEHTKKINKDVTFEVVESAQLAGLYVDIVALFGLTC